MSLKLQVDHAAASQAAPLRLQLGCGYNLLPGWINTDSQPVATADYLDFTRPFPFSSNAFDAVFCEHTIEHIEKAEASHMVAEVFRVLKSGGRFRVVTPSLENFCRLALEPQSPTAQTYLAFHRNYTRDAKATIADAVNRIFYSHGHRHIYAMSELALMLQQAGFAEIKAMPAGTYGDEIFHGVDGHGRVIGADINAIEAMALEATKP
jgi:predicted SAM-dependent methyltransferase